MVDSQGKLLSTTDYGFTLAAGYTGEWQMMPSPDGFVMLQASAGTRLLHFDAQARLIGSASDLYPAGDYAPAENGGAQPYPVALNGAGKMGVLWNGKATTTTAGGVMGVALDTSGAPVLPSGRTDLTQETLSTNWAGNVRVADIDAHALGGGLAIAGSVVGAFKAGDAVGDVLVLADYAVNSAPLSAQTPALLRFTLPGGAALGPSPVFRQMLFADHALLLAGDEAGVKAFYTKRIP